MGLSLLCGECSPIDGQRGAICKQNPCGDATRTP
jgi:hypothetical protein